MHRLLNYILFSVLLVFCTGSAFAVSYPNPSGFVNDFANLYSSDFRINLERNLSDFEATSSAQLAVVTIKSLEGMDIETYAVELFKNWGIGKKDEDNGLLLLIAKDERKIRIEVGYGLEPYITDGRAGEIIRNQISPQFKQENYEAGTLAAVEKVKTYILDKDIAPKDTKISGFSGVPDWLIILGFFLFYLIVTYAASYLGRTKEIWPGGVLGGVIGGAGGLIVLPIAGLVIGALVFGGIGLLLDFILSKNFQVRKQKRLPTDFWHTWGGFSSGGGWGKGGSGGFGGFGGGSSGGGGASGGW